MGTRLPKTICDYERFGLNVGVRCRACGRTAVFDHAEVMTFFVAPRIPMGVPVTAEPFRC
jgi:hypothetical protein